MANNDRLPREILVQIFSYYLKTETQRDLLRNIAKVCRYWKEVCNDSLLWHKFDGTASMEYLKRRCKKGYLRNTKALEFSYRKKHLNSLEFREIFENLPRVKSINFSQICDQFEKSECDFLAELINHCPDLCEITFADTHKLNLPKLPSKSLENFLTVRGSNLTSLDISNLTIQAFRDLMMIIASSCPNLECLKAQNLNPGNKPFPIQHMQKGLEKLKVLRLGHPVTMQLNSSVTSNGFPNLDTFTHPSKCDCYFQDSYLRKLLMNSPDLKVLDVRGCTLLTPSALLSLPANNLERLYVSNTKLYEHHGFIDVVLKWGHSLVALDVSKMKGSSINSLFKSLISACSLQNLESLELNHTMVTTSTVKLIVQNCPKLNFLQLESCRSFGRGLKHAYYGQAKIRQLLSDDIEDEMEIT